MREFYRLRMSDSTTSKAEALRQAQLALLNGTIQGDASGARGAGRNPEVLTFAKDPQRPYAHPYFWAPFVLMGNWK
jgi:CHAT domain-containing protein